MVSDYEEGYSFLGDSASLAPTAGEPATFFVRALYDYQSTDASSLTFHKGDLIEVLTQLESGWWDGLLEDERGWFPSNYVVPVSEDEVEQEFRARGYEPERVEDAMVPMQPPPSTFVNDAVSWNSNGDSHRTMVAPTSSSFLPRTTVSQSPDSWIPKMSQSGNIYYVNTDTGEESAELPTMAEDVPEVDVPSRHGHDVDPYGSYDHGTPNAKDINGVLGVQRAGTPEPWIRKTTDDGMAYYYWNPISHQVRWTPPSPAPEIRPRRDGPHQPLPNGIMRRGTVSSAASDFVGLYEDGPFYTGPLHDVPNPFAELGYGNGFDSITTRPTLPSNSSSHSGHSGSRRTRAIRRLPDAPLVDGRKALQYAVELQSLLAPEEEVYLIKECAVYAREAIQIVIETATQVMDESPITPRDGIDFIRERRLAGHIEDDVVPHPQLSGRVAQAAAAVLNLLLASGKLVPPIQEADLEGDSAIQEYLRSISSDPLTGFHRKVAANLSRLILSSRAADSVPDARPPEMAVTLERDARELERSVVAFVLELDKIMDSAAPRRITAELSPGKGAAGIGTGIIGGGIGAGWRSNGFVAIDDDSTAMKPPDTKAIKELNDISISVDQQLTKLSELINMAYSRQYNSRAGSPTDPYLEQGDPVLTDLALDQGLSAVPPEVITQVVHQCQLAVTQLAAFLDYAETLDLASHLDFDGGVGTTSGNTKLANHNDDYDANVRQARHLMRAFEITKQSLYDQTAALLIRAQTASAPSLSSWTTTFDQNVFHTVLSAASSLKSGTVELMETLDSLVEVVIAQAEAADPSRRGRIGARSANHRESSDGAPGDYSVTMGVHSTSHTAFAGLLEQNTHGELNLGDAIHPFSAINGRESYRSHAELPRLDISASNASAPTTQHSVLKAKLSSDSGTRVAEVNRDGTEETDMAEAPPDDGEIDEQKEDKSATEDARIRRERKLKNILGPDAPIAMHTAPREPEYMQPMYKPPDILYNSDQGVRGGTLPALVEHLTLHNRLDSTFNETFLMTFKSFATVDEVVTELIARFNLPAPQNVTPEQFNEWKESKQKRYRFRTMNILKALIQSQTLTQSDLPVLDRIKEFAESIQESDMMAPKMQVLQTIKMRRDEAQAKKYTANGLQDPPPSILPKNLRKFKLNELDPVELARQLTIMESRLFNRVHPTECLERGKDKPATSLAEDNIKAIIHMSNQLAAWVTDSVLAKDEVKRRAAVIRFWISVAEQCKRLKNFSTMAALTAGLNGPPIRRLRRSWEQVHTRANDTLADLEKTIDSGRNFAEYRRLLATIDPPCVPFFGLPLKDLTFIHEGNSDFIPVAGGKVINFDKRQRTSQVIREVQRYQAATYDLTPVDAIIEFINQSMESVSQDFDYWPKSLEREPREREEERMARLLQESGFL
ncbi:ras GEF [Calocera cornea HHB12733]|uniref:Ras GEF n=1 Tax=Calocera cornea HHB12733 TaxID=1353952 RepID=A0A165F7F7_9BASI|nr:ras GEF [Calocera cornea HHB12733]